MSTRDGYYKDLLVAWLLRGGLLIGSMAILAILLSGCTRDGSTPVFSFNGEVTSAERPPLNIGPGEAGQTRNVLPYNKECHEKSDSSLTKPPD